MEQASVEESVKFFAIAELDPTKDRQNNAATEKIVLFFIDTNSQEMNIDFTAILQIVISKDKTNIPLQNF